MVANPFSPEVILALPEQVRLLLSNTKPSLQVQRWLPNKFRQACSQFPLLLSHSFTSEKNKIVLNGGTDWWRSITKIGLKVGGGGGGNFPIYSFSKYNPDVLTTCKAIIEATVSGFVKCAWADSSTSVVFPRVFKFRLKWLDRVLRWRYRPSLNAKYAFLRNNLGNRLWHVW